MIKTIQQHTIDKLEPDFGILPNDDAYKYYADFGLVGVKFYHKATNYPVFRYVFGWEQTQDIFFEMGILDAAFANIIEKQAKKIIMSGNCTYEILPQKIKENIVINKQPNKNYFEFGVRYSEKVTVEVSDGVMYVYADMFDITQDPQDVKKLMLTLERPFITDSLNRTQYFDIEIIDKVVNNGVTTYKTKFSVPQNILNNAAYPITFDPTTVVTSSYTLMMGFRFHRNLPRMADGNYCLPYSIYSTSTRNAYWGVSNGDDWSSISFSELLAGGSAGYTYSPSVSVDFSGNVWIVLTKNNGSSSAIKVYKSTNNASSFTNVISQTLNYTFTHGIAIGLDERLYWCSCYPNASNYYMMSLDTTAGSPTLSAEMSYTAGDYPHFIYDKYNEKLYMVRYYRSGSRFYVRRFDITTSAFDDSGWQYISLTFGSTASYVMPTWGYVKSNGNLVIGANGYWSSTWHARVLEYNYGSNSQVAFTDYETYNYADVFMDEKGDEYLFLNDGSKIDLKVNGGSATTVFTAASGETIGANMFFAGEHGYERSDPWKTFGTLIIQTSDSTSNYIKVITDLNYRLPVAV